MFKLFLFYSNILIIFAANFSLKRCQRKWKISEKDPTTEEKIKEAARKAFQKGYAGTRTRDIADEAGRMVIKL